MTTHGRVCDTDGVGWFLCLHSFEFHGYSVRSRNPFTPVPRFREGD